MTASASHFRTELSLLVASWSTRCPAAEVMIVLIDSAGAVAAGARLDMTTEALELAFQDARARNAKGVS